MSLKCMLVPSNTKNKHTPLFYYINCQAQVVWKVDNIIQSLTTQDSSLFWNIPI